MSRSRVTTLSIDAPVDSSVDEESVPKGFNAAETTNMIGNSEKATASRATP